MFNFKQISISMVVVTLLSWFGSTQVGGDGFLPDNSQAPVGFTTGSLVTALILGALVGLIPWSKIGNLVKRIFKSN